MSTLENLIKVAIKRHPTKGRLLTFSEEDMKRAWKSCEANTRMMGPLLEAMHHERIEALMRAKDFVVG